MTVPANRSARVPAAVNLVLGDLSDDDIVFIATYGTMAAQTTLAVLRSYFTLVESFVLIDDTRTSYQMENGDGGVVNGKTVAGALAVLLPESPSIGEVVRVSDFTGDITTFPLSVAAPNGGTINGQTGALTYAANYETTGFQAITETDWIMRP